MFGVFFCFFFFFSSRRRHTRWMGDWSSDVCSTDLWARGAAKPEPYAAEFQAWVKERIERRDFESLADYWSLSTQGVRAHPTDVHFLPLFVALGAARSEERRVGKECRARVGRERLET